MNKLTKTLLLFFSILLSSSFVVAQQSNPSKSLIGSWKFVSKQMITETPTTIHEENESYISPLTVTYRFKANGTGELEKVYEDIEDASEPLIFDIEKWFVKGDKITILSEYETIENYKYSIQGGTLVISTSFKEEDETISIQYTFKKS